MKIGPRLLKL